MPKAADQRVDSRSVAVLSRHIDYLDEPFASHNALHRIALIEVGLFAVLSEVFDLSGRKSTRGYVAYSLVPENPN
jgi:hypothetical protein